MKGLAQAGRWINEPVNLERLETIRKKHSADQLLFIDAVTPFFKIFLDSLSCEQRKIIALFRDYTRLPFKAIAAFSRRPGNESAVHLGRLESAGILKKDSQGFWILANRDLQRYLFARLNQGTIIWIEKQEKILNKSRAIDEYISLRETEIVKNWELDKFIFKGRRR